MHGVLHTACKPLQRLGAVALAGILSLALAPSSFSQERTSCLGGAPGAPSVFIDSTASEVSVFTTDGLRLTASRNLLLCPGDEVQTGATGRVAIRFDQKRTVIRLDGNSRTRVLSGGTGSGDVSLISGILYFVSSVRRHFQVDTPYIVAGIDGTEAIVAVRPRDALAMAVVREGLVSAYDQTVGQNGELKVAGGEAAYRSMSVPFQSAPIGALPPPFRELLIASDSAVDWAVYYPPILLVRDARSAAVRKAVTLLASGDYEKAEAALDAGGGATPAATAALRTIIAISRNHIADAERWSGIALQADPEFAPASIAASYVHQAKGDLTGALEFAQSAAKVAPNDPYALARLAEVQMIIGDRRAALATANQTLAIERLPLALFVAGLAELAASHYEKAEALFEEAIALDDEAPLPRLGLGLARIRQGHTSAGTWEIERAVILDPRRAALRTWLARGYFDEALTAKAAEELRLAKAEDPEDPTPYLFSALRLFAENRPIPALRELQQAEERGNLRRTLRATRGLGEDTATRGAAEGRIYDVLGFEQLAINAGARATDADPSNPGGHRFFADAYRQFPGYEAAQTSELLRSQLLSPPSKTPVQPELAEADLALLDTTGPSRVTFAEFSPLFDADGFRLDGFGLIGTQNTFADQVSATALYKNASVSVGQYHYATDGFRENNDLRHDIYNAIGTLAITPEFSVFGEYRLRETKGGDRPIDFDINSYDPTVRATLEREVARAGFHAQPTSKSDLVGVYTWARLNSTSRSTDPFGFDLVSEATDESDSGQVQHIQHFDRARTVIGGTYIHNDIVDVAEIFGFPSEERFERDYRSAYGYLYLDLPDFMTWTFGGAWADYKERPSDLEITEFLPKIGVTAALGKHLNVRAAYLQHLKPDLVSEQVIEPTHVAGFSQLYDGYNGSRLEQIGAGADLSFGPLVIGGEYVRRDWDIPSVGAPDADLIERVSRAYLYATLTDRLAFSAEYVLEHSDGESPFDFDHWRTATIPLKFGYFDPTGFFSSAELNFVEHEFQELSDSGTDKFQVLNATLGYRIPNNRGVFSVEVLNLLDESFHFQNRTLRPDIAVKPRYAPERTIYARGSLRF